MSSNLIIIGGGFLQVPLINTAISMGLGTIVFDMSKDALGMRLAHHPILMSTRDIEGCVREARKLAKNLDIHGVITAGTDASQAVAAIAGALGLAGIRYSDAQACSNKVLMRRRLRDHKLPIPDFYPVWSLKEAREAMDCLNFPLVLKPAENMGARGVIKIESRQEMQTAFRHSKKYSTTGEMIIEEYMLGAELSVDALAWQGQFQITGIADRIISREPFFIELGHNMPSSQTVEIQEEASHLMVQAMQALGIHTGAAKGDLKITSDGVKVGEVAARLSGGFMSSHTYPLHCGANLLKAAIEISLNKAPSSIEESLKQSRQVIAIERSILAPPGKIIQISGVDTMASINNIKHIYINRKAGDIMPHITSNIDKLGHIIATGNTLEEAESAVEQSLSHLELAVDESYGVDWQEVKKQARQLFGEQVCWVCKVCDGENCASSVPGMGGVGQMNSFRDNSRALNEIHILPRYIRDPIQVDTSWEFLGHKFEYPIMAAPMTGAVTNMNSALTEYDFGECLLSACRKNNSIAWVGDGASPQKYLTIMKALQAVDGFGIPIFKPRADKKALQERFQIAEELGVLALGMDIDAIHFKTMQNKGQQALARSPIDLRRIRELTKLPFIVKGIMTVEDAQAAIEAGADAIVVSNHGGRILDSMPGTARVLPTIANFIGDKVPVLVDGGIRSGQDVFKMLALGATAVLVGRPIAIAAVGGGRTAVQSLLSHYGTELKKSMELCGTALLENISKDYLAGPGLEKSSHPIKNIF